MGMKSTAIRKHLDAKVEDWIGSIKDSYLRKICRRDTLVMGGSIASMLMGEKVNDYDLYFKTKGTALAVARYYADMFNVNAVRASVEDVEKARVIKEEDIHNLSGGVVAAFSKRVKGEKRVMLYVPDKGLALEREHVDSMKSSYLKRSYRPLCLSSNAITLSNKVQLIVRFFGRPSTIHANFDFTHAFSVYNHCTRKKGMCAGSLELDAKALECLLSRTLLYNNSLYPLAALFRVRKFLSRGFTISAGQLFKIAWAINELDLRDVDVLSEQLAGVDKLYMEEFISAVSARQQRAKEMNKELPIDYAFVSAVINRLFE